APKCGCFWSFYRPVAGRGTRCLSAPVRCLSMARRCFASIWGTPFLPWSSSMPGRGIRSRFCHSSTFASFLAEHRRPPAPTPGRPTSSCSKRALPSGGSSGRSSPRLRSSSASFRKWTSRPNARSRACERRAAICWSGSLSHPCRSLAGRESSGVRTDSVEYWRAADSPTNRATATRRACADSDSVWVMNIAIIGTGYVGLVAGTGFADSGNDVICADIDEKKIRTLSAGEVPIYEPGLEELLHKNMREKRLSFTTDVGAAVSASQVVFIAVGTPEGEIGDADLQYVLSAAQKMGRSAKRYTVVVVKSTVPVGTCDKVRETIRQLTSVEVDVVSNPEFLKEGAAIDDFFKPDRVVIGTQSARARQMMSDLYSPFVRTENPILFMDARSAELTKYASNAMLATRISFMNDIALLCERVAADVDSVRKGMGADRRIGYPFLFPGVGYGGSCFPKDVKALIATARELGIEFDLLRAVERTNDRQKRLLVTKAVKHFGSLAGRSFGVWGAS